MQGVDLGPEVAEKCIDCPSSIINLRRPLRFICWNLVTFGFEPNQTKIVCVSERLWKRKLDLNCFWTSFIQNKFKPWWHILTPWRGLDSVNLTFRQVRIWMIMIRLFIRFVLVKQPSSKWQYDKITDNLHFQGHGYGGGNVKGAGHLRLQFYGNERTMNLNPLILSNVQGSPYFKVIDE